MDSDLIEPVAEAPDAEAPEAEAPEAETAPADEAFRDLMASIGYLMYHWNGLETALVDEIRRLRQEGGDTGKNLVRVRGSLSERLAEWGALHGLRNRGNRQFAQGVAELSSQIERLRRTRNLIAQSFAGATSEGDEPAILCADGDFSPPTSEPRRIPLSEVREIIDQVRSCQQRIPTMESR